MKISWLLVYMEKCLTSWSPPWSLFQTFVRNRKKCSMQLPLLVSWLKGQVYAPTQVKAARARGQAQWHSGHLCPQPHVVLEKPGAGEPWGAWVALVTCPPACSFSLHPIGAVVCKILPQAADSKHRHPSLNDWVLCLRLGREAHWSISEEVKGHCLVVCCGTIAYYFSIDVTQLHTYKLNT